MIIAFIKFTMHLFLKNQVNFHQLCNYISLPRRESTQFGERLLPANFVPCDFRFSFQMAHKYNIFFFGDDSFKLKKGRLKELGT